MERKGAIKWNAFLRHTLPHSLVVEFIESVGKVMVTQSGNRKSVCGHEQDFVGFLILVTKVVNNFETTKGNGKNNARFLYFGFRHASMSIKNYLHMTSITALQYNNITVFVQQKLPQKREEVNFSKYNIYIYILYIKFWLEILILVFQNCYIVIL